MAAWSMQLVVRDGGSTVAVRQRSERPALDLEGFGGSVRCWLGCSADDGRAQNFLDLFARTTFLDRLLPSPFLFWRRLCLDLLLPVKLIAFSVAWRDGELLCSCSLIGILVLEPAILFSR
ncbi:hypothetical protein HAX54_001849 [Datura stramonium]|uniref:Uncharacterized protein n=1 Tax=Datura stramonium TaxID=4076 RepID=A0ABS8T4I1_DATST|nr:hypothetical protein [Datura stramonium]